MNDHTPYRTDRKREAKRRRKESSQLDSLSMLSGCPPHATAGKDEEPLWNFDTSIVLENAGGERAADFSHQKAEDMQSSALREFDSRYLQ